MEIISRQVIKPSSPTPHHLQNYRLSFLDQISPHIYPAIILFYESNPDINLSNAEKSGHLKSSLSETLTRFYPIAGRLINDEYIYCNDEGVPYIEAHVRSKLSEVIHNHNLGEFDKFLPHALDNFYGVNVLLTIQVNFFECGGLAIVVCLSHKVADATSRMMFLNSWATTLRGHDDIILNSPLFESATQFPHREIDPLSLNNPIVKDPKEKIVTKMFIFNGSMLEIMKTTFSDDHIRSTRIEALTAFLSNRYAVITKASTEGSTNFSVTHTINIRSRMEPPLSKNHFGNYYAFAQAKPSIEEVKGGCRGKLVTKIREAIKGIDGKFVFDNIRDSDKYLDFFNEMAGEIGKGVVGLKFTSWCRIGVYEIDFGWGKPVRAGLTSFMLKNFVRFLDTKAGNGIEAWISMEEKDMAKLEGDQEFLSYISSTMACT